MKIYRIVFSKQAKKDIDQLSPKQKAKLKTILQNTLSLNPYLGKPLKGNLKGLYSYRLNFQDRLVYEIYDEDLVILVIRAKTHYGD